MFDRKAYKESLNLTKIGQRDSDDIAREVWEMWFFIDRYGQHTKRRFFKSNFRLFREVCRKIKPISFSLEVSNQQEKRRLGRNPERYNLATELGSMMLLELGTQGGKTPDAYEMFKNLEYYETFLKDGE